MKRLLILGSTGSIGRSSLDVVGANPDGFAVAGLVAGTSVDLMCAQTERFHPEAVCMHDHAAAAEVRRRVGPRVKVYEGRDGMLEMIRKVEADAVVNGIVGSAGMLPTVVALECGRDVLLANKETMVMAGMVVREALRRSSGRIVPIDSEMSAIYQCLKGEAYGSIRRLVLTASGGPFADRPADTFDGITVAEALNHPTWNMGTKNTIDSATLMNKGLEVIEASYLFDIPGDRIDVTIHRTSVVHSFVEFVDGSLLCQLSKPDMRLAIQYAMTDPDRVTSPWGGLDFAAPFQLAFEPPDRRKFPCLDIAYEALARGGTAPAAMNGANEAAVEAFVAGKIGFADIPRLIRSAIETHFFIDHPEIGDLVATDESTKRSIENMIR